MLVLACSATKIDPGYSERDPRRGIDRRKRVSLVDLYDGPSWRMVRKLYACGGQLLDGTEVWALSAEHGLAPCYAYSAIYERQLVDEDDARALVERKPAGVYFANRYRDAVERDVRLFGGRLYALAFERYVEQLDVRVRWSAFPGGIGDKLGALRRYLDS